MLLDLLILQPIDLCNLNCSYCYLPGRRDPKLMSDEILEASIRCAFNSSFITPISDSDRLTIVWHSGEPLSAKIPFYQKALSLISKYNVKNIPIKNNIQTNATLINQEWCNFFKENDFEIGVSIDGPKFLHDTHRRDWKNRGSFDKVMTGITLLRENKLPLRAICVLTKKSLSYAYEIYNFFKNNGFQSVGFNIDEVEGFNNSSSMEMQDSIEEYKQFMSKMYDLWTNDNKIMEIREFDTATKTLLSKRYHPEYQAISTETLPFAIVSITKDGYITTFSPELSGGIPSNRKNFAIDNVINIDSLDELIDNPRFIDMKNKIFTGVNNCAQKCKYFELCGGGSPSNKYSEKGSFEATETIACTFSRKALIDVMLTKLRHKSKISELYVSY